MKRQNLFLFLSFIFTFTFSNFVNGKSLNKEYIKVDKKARKLKNKILRTKSNYSVNGVLPEKTNFCRNGQVRDIVAVW